jgi:hypothetical protein
VLSPHLLWPDLVLSSPPAAKLPAARTPWCLFVTPGPRCIQPPPKSNLTYQRSIILRGAAALSVRMRPMMNESA